MKGIYIVFEGSVGTGKSTQAKKLFDFLKERFPSKDIILTREPGGTEISENIRKLVQGTAFDEKMDKVTDAYLYASSRAQSLRQIVKPVIESGGIVISDRSFVTSLAYQGYAQGLGINKVLDINKTAVEGFMPDAIVYFDLPLDIGHNRTFDKSGDKWEKLDIDFFEKVNVGYKEVKKLDMTSWIDIDAKGSIEEVFDRLINSLKEILSL